MQLNFRQRSAPWRVHRLVAGGSQLAGWTAILIAVVYGAQFGLFTSVAADTSRAEVVHWWISPGEKSAISVLRRAYEARGGVWLDNEAVDSYTSRSVSVSKMTNGQSPSAMQWNAGAEAKSFLQFGFTRAPKILGIALDDYADMPQSVRAVVKQDGHYTGIPIGIHGENWAWYSRKIFAELDLEPPRTWTELIDQAKRIADAGYLPISLSNQAWQTHLLFRNVLLGVAGINGYRKLYVEQEPSFVRTARFAEVLQTFTALKPYTQSYHGDVSWKEAVKLVADNKAAINFNGDWAKGEFNAMGLSPGEDYLCALAPASESAYVLVVDMFVFGNLSPTGGLDGQTMLAEVLADRAVQQAFSEAKGSLPAMHVNESLHMDSCAQVAYRHVHEIDKVLPSLPQLDRDSTGVERVVSQVWNNPQITISEAIEMFRLALNRADAYP